MTLSANTQSTYRYGMKMLVELRLVDPLMTLQAFALADQPARYPI